jgi:hypothetical protein
MHCAKDQRGAEGNERLDNRFVRIVDDERADKDDRRRARQREYTSTESHFRSIAD